MTLLRCKKCGEIIWSRNRHDMRWCKCGSAAIDGGLDYCKVTGEPAVIQLANVDANPLVDEDVRKSLDTVKWGDL